MIYCHYGGWEGSLVSSVTGAGNIHIHFFAGILFQLVQFTFNNEQTSFNFMILENER